MKKLLVIAVIFALISSAAFAETSIGGQVQWGNVLVGNNGDDNLVGGTDVSEGHIQVTASGDNAGGDFRFKPLPNSEWGGQIHVWWAPIEQLRIDIGSTSGSWGRDAISGWGFLGPAKIGGKISGPAYEDNPDGPGTMAGVGFYPGFGWNDYGLGFSIMPMDALTIRLGYKAFGGPNNNDMGQGTFNTNTPDWTGDGAAHKADKDNVVPRLTFQVIYNFEGIGNLSVAANLNTGDEVTSYSPSDLGKPGTGTKLFVDFHLNEAIEGLELQLGLAYILPTKVKDTGDYQPPLEIGFGAAYSAGDFGVKARIGAILGGQFKPKVGDTYATDTTIAIGLLPYYNVADGVTVYGHFGFNIWMDSKDADPKADNVIGWFFNPYVTIPTGVFDFWVGFKVYSDGQKKYGDDGDATKVVWAIPLGFQVNF